MMEAGQIESLVRNGLKSKLRLMNREALEGLLLSQVFNAIDAHIDLDRVNSKLDEVNTKGRKLKERIICLTAQVSKLLEATSLDMESPRPMHREAYRVQRHVAIQHWSGRLEPEKSGKESKPRESLENLLKECTELMETAKQHAADLSKSRRQANEVLAEGKPVAAVTAQYFTPPLPPAIVNARPFQNMNLLYPPRPSLQARLSGTSIDLIWTVALQPDHAEIQKYQVYYFKRPWESWSKLYEVSGLSTPICVNVSEIESGRYSFTVRGIDVFDRTGPFSQITSVTL